MGIRAYLYVFVFVWGTKKKATTLKGSLRNQFKCLPVGNERLGEGRREYILSTDH